MLLTRLRCWLIIGMLLAGTAIPARARDLLPNGKDFLPFSAVPGVTEEHNMRPWEHADLSTYGNGPKANEGFFFQYDKLIWAFNSPNTSIIGDVGAERVYDLGRFGQFFNFNSLDTSFMETEWVQGNRYEGGYMYDQHGWLFSIAHARQYHQTLLAQNVTVAFNDPLGVASSYIDTNGDGIQEDVNGNGIFGNSTPNNVDTDGDFILDAYAGPDAGDLVQIPIVFGNALVNNQTRFTTMELMHLVRWDRMHSGATVEWMAGLRFINLTDEFSFRGTNGTAIFDSLFFLNRINNYLLGPQIGIRANHQSGAWKMGVEARGVAAVNFQNARLGGNFVGITPDVRSTTFDSATTDEEFSAVGELRLDVGYQISKAVSLRMGYTGIFISDIGRASRRVTYSLPNMEITNGNKNDGFFINGFNFGVEINR